MIFTRSSYILSFLFTAITVFVIGVQGKAEPEITTPEFASESDTVNAGYLRLEWELPGTESYDSYAFEVEQAEDQDFSNGKVIYKGPDLASFVSGLPDGTYHYRVRAVKEEDISPWSESLVVFVEHHPLSTAFLFCSIGGVVFLITVAVVIHGSVRERNEQ